MSLKVFFSPHIVIKKQKQIKIVINIHFSKYTKYNENNGEKVIIHNQK